MSLVALAALLAALPAARAQTGGPFALTRSTIGGGGGASTGGVYSVTGTIGQPDAGLMGGGNYSLAGGFWSVMQTPGAPLLRITRTSATGATVFWPAPSPGWVLQQTTALASRPELIVWTDVTSPAVVVVGSENIVKFVATTGQRYFRLRHP